MRKLLVVIVVAGFGIYYFRSRPTDVSETQPMRRAAVSASPTQSVSSPAPATMWPKRSIDRAREVATQAQQQRKASENP